MPGNMMAMIKHCESPSPIQAATNGKNLVHEETVFLRYHFHLTKCWEGICEMQHGVRSEWQRAAPIAFFFDSFRQRRWMCEIYTNSTCILADFPSLRHSAWWPKTSLVIPNSFSRSLLSFPRSSCTTWSFLGFFVDWSSEHLVGRKRQRLLFGF